MRFQILKLFVKPESDVEQTHTYTNEQSQSTSQSEYNKPKSCADVSTCFIQPLPHVQCHADIHQKTMKLFWTLLIIMVACSWCDQEFKNVHSLLQHRNTCAVA
jgi:hypothetical protein